MALWKIKNAKAIFKGMVNMNNIFSEKQPLLRISTAGSVDDGKSTLIGRLLHDSKSLLDDQLSALQSRKMIHHNGKDTFDLASLTDGLKAEREQGITIDVAYRYFATPKRNYILADTPGHEQYTRNMVTGASSADVALILIDARNGILVQTKRHSYLANLLGIQNFVVVVNKMDLISYSEKNYLKIVDSYQNFADKTGIKNITFIPLSALEGDNVVNPSNKMSWFSGKPLLEHLDSIVLEKSIEHNEFRFPVQYVLRPNQDFRGFSGTVSSGKISVGDQIEVLPSKFKSTVKEIVTYDGNKKDAIKSEAITLTLTDEIDVSRGNMIVKKDFLPKSAHKFSSMLVWLNEKSYDSSRTYLVKHTSRYVKAKIGKIHHHIDMKSLDKLSAETFSLNEIGKTDIFTQENLYFETYKDNRTLGSFILIDALSNDTVAAGMILNTLESSPEKNQKVQSKEMISALRNRVYGQSGMLLIVSNEAELESINFNLIERGCFTLPIDSTFSTFNPSVINNLIESNLVVLIKQQDVEKMKSHSFKLTRYLTQGIDFESGNLTNLLNLLKEKEIFPCI